MENRLIPRGRFGFPPFSRPDRPKRREAKRKRRRPTESPPAFVVGDVAVPRIQASSAASTSSQNRLGGLD
ncbi:MAG: hypothetical protein ACOC98_05920, partial [Thermodesulfobacteriota bacterium]